MLDHKYHFCWGVNDTLVCSGNVLLEVLMCTLAFPRLLLSILFSGMTDLVALDFEQQPTEMGQKHAKGHSLDGQLEA